MERLVVRDCRLGTARSGDVVGWPPVAVDVVLVWEAGTGGSGILLAVETSAARDSSSLSAHGILRWTHVISPSTLVILAHPLTVMGCEVLPLLVHTASATLHKRHGPLPGAPAAALLLPAAQGDADRVAGALGRCGATVRRETSAAPSAGPSPPAPSSAAWWKASSWLITLLLDSKTDSATMARAGVEPSSVDDALTALADDPDLHFSLLRQLRSL
jgi:hypothetical protein